MSEYLGRAFDRDLQRAGCFVFAVLVALVVCAFFLGRCSAKYEVRTPVVEKSNV